MNKTIFGLALTLAATAALAEGKPDRPDPIVVNVINGKPQVPEDPAYTEEGHGGLCWKLTTPGYQFTENGIVIHSPDWNNCHLEPSCDKSGSNTGFRCAKVPPHKHGARYNYSVNVIDKNAKPLPSLDPVIENH